jgi:hypothetical protein
MGHKSKNSPVGSHNLGKGRTDFRRILKPLKHVRQYSGIFCRVGLRKADVMFKWGLEIGSLSLFSSIWTHNAAFRSLAHKNNQLLQAKGRRVRRNRGGAGVHLGPGASIRNTHYCLSPYLTHTIDIEWDDILIIYFKPLDDYSDYLWTFVQTIIERPDWNPQFPS